MSRYLGLKGEEFAVKYLESKGYKILEQNYTVPMGEVDIIAMQGKNLAFVEVKARAYEAYGGPVAAVTKSKQRRIYMAAVAYLKLNNIDYNELTFDVITITDKEIDHIPAAFTPPRGTM